MNGLGFLELIGPLAVVHVKMSSLYNCAHCTCIVQVFMSSVLFFGNRVYFTSASENVLIVSIVSAMSRALASIEVHAICGVI